MTDYVLTVATFIAINAIAALGLNIITGYAGQPHLGIGIYTSVGAYVTALLVTRLSVPLVPTLATALVAAAALGMLTGLPALRVNNDFLAILTIALAFVVESLYAYLPQRWFGGPLGITEIPKPTMFGAPLESVGFFLFAAALMGVALCCNRVLVKSWLGLAWTSVREDEVASRTSGNNTAALKIVAFAIGGMYAGLAGALYAQFMGSVSPADFGFLPSLFVVTMVMVGGVGTITGPIVGAVILGVLPELFRFVQEYRNLIYGGLLVGVMLYQPYGLVGRDSFIRRRVRRLLRVREHRVAVSDRPAVQAPLALDGNSRAASVALEVSDVAVSFGGLKALNGVSLRVAPGQVLGVIGPNGAGKTSLFNVISGVLKSRTGSVRFGGARIDRLKIHEIARAGVGRTFQIVRPFPALSVLENVLVPFGARRCLSPMKWWRRYTTSPVVEQARAILTSTGLAAYADHAAGVLPLGLQRRLEIARIIALGADVLLLDEPFSGLSAEEAESQKKLVSELRRQGRAVILIEHDMDVAVELCDWFTVLNFGHKIAEGIPSDVCANPLVVEAYLGRDDD